MSELNKLVVSQYEIAFDELTHRGAKIQRMRGRGVIRWAVYSEPMGYALNRSGEWEWEPQPSSRDDAFFARCRFATPEEALAVYRARKVEP